MAKIDYERMRFNDRVAPSGGTSFGKRPTFPPTAKQLKLIEKLLGELGEERAAPTTSRQASAVIKTLLTRKRGRVTTLAPGRPWGR
jgi:hypothetical protein